MEAALLVLFAPAALIAASALGIHQFFALWRVFASAVNTRSGSGAWKAVQPGKPWAWRLGGSAARLRRALTPSDAPRSFEAAQRGV
jgi:hypothetical protein